MMKSRKGKSESRRVQSMTSQDIVRLMELDKYCILLKRIAKLLEMKLDFQVHYNGCSSNYESRVHACILMTRAVDMHHALRIVSKKRYKLDVYRETYDIETDRLYVFRNIQFRNFTNKPMLKMTFSTMARELLYHYFMDTEIFVQTNNYYLYNYCNNSWKSVIDLDASTIDELELILTLNSV